MLIYERLKNRTERLFFMVANKIKVLKHIIYSFGCCVFLFATVAFFGKGGETFGKEHTKVLNYVNSVCRIVSQSYHRYQCRIRFSVYTCYGPVWNAYYGENETIFGMVEVEQR